MSERETVGVAGAGTIGCGLAAVASASIEVTLWARSASSAERARAGIETICSRIQDAGADPARVEVVTELERLRGASFLIEAIAEDLAGKARLLGELGELARGAGRDTILATTTSSLPVQELADASGQPERFAGLHVFNPVAKMQLVELVFPRQAHRATRERTVRLCEALGKTAVEVPDTPGFVVNRLLFPYLFSAVRLVEETGMDPVDVDTCMKLGAGHPMGPLALLDLVGLDVSQAIGETIGESVPPRIGQLISEGALGRKSGRGIHVYG